MDKFAIFNNSATDSVDEGHISFPINCFTGCHPLSDTTLGMYFKSLVYNDTNTFQENYEIVLTINTNKHKDVMQAIAKEFATAENINIIVADDETSTYLHSDITSVTFAFINALSWRPGHHGRNDTIKVLPKDFIAADNGRPIMINDATTDERWLHSDGSNLMYASVIVPYGYKAISVRIYGSDTGQSFKCYSAAINTKDVVDIGTGTTAIGSTCTLDTPLTTTTDGAGINYLLIEVTSDGSSDEIYGGSVAISMT